MSDLLRPIKNVRKFPLLDLYIWRIMSILFRPKQHGNKIVSRHWRWKYCEVTISLHYFGSYITIYG